MLNGSIFVRLSARYISWTTHPDLTKMFYACCCMYPVSGGVENVIHNALLRRLHVGLPVLSMTSCSTMGCYVVLVAWLHPACKLLLGIGRENEYPKLVSKFWGLPQKHFRGGQSLEISILKHWGEGPPRGT